MAKKHVDVPAEKKGPRKAKAARGARSITTVRREDAEEENFQLWVNDQLRRLYDPVLDEPIPESMLELLRKNRRSS